jgi:hypothetical protein
MIFQNNTLQSGKEYTLSQIFSSNHKIIIPDLQRDYCWGDKAWNKDADKYTELVSGFLENLIVSYKENEAKDLTLGLIYGYESPKYHIQLCDGQQRITTLFLILGVVNRKTENHFQSKLISTEELNNDRNPYLQYAIRESTLYFLSDLVCEYFLKLENQISFSMIENSTWFFSDYNLDSSIKSMLSAIITIEEKFNKSIEIDFKQFGNFILNKLQMLYYDMGNRIQGEETFVIINTTGEPLSATENLKPIIIGNIVKEEERKITSDEWEEREEWFWQNKTKEETTSDDGMNQFFIWYWQIRLLQERSWKDKTAYPLNPRELFTKKPKTDQENEENPETERWEESIKTVNIHNYFKAFQQLVDLSRDEKIARVLKTIKNESISVSWFRNADLHVVLPLIAYLEKFPESKFFYEFTRRIRKNHFDEKRKRGNNVDWRHIIQIIEFSKSEEEVLVFKTKSNEIIEFKSISNVELKEWFTQDEQFKNLLKKQYKTEIELWEDHIDLMGNLSSLWKANQEKENSYGNLKDIYNNFELLYNSYDENGAKENPILSNYIRLYRLLLEEDVRIGHIERTSGMLGAWFSWKNNNDNVYLKYLKLPDFISLFNIEKQNLLNEIKQRLKNNFAKENFNISTANYKADQHLKCWLFLKTFQAEKHNILLSHIDGNGIASYFDHKRNKLNSELDFSLANSICGYGIKSGFGAGNEIRYATDYWGKQHCFDTPISNFITKEEFVNRENKPIQYEKIEIINKEIQELLNDFYSEE